MTAPQSPSRSLELRGIRKRFGDVTVLDGIDLNIQAGEFVSLLGPSGCGKTTLLRIIAGHDVPDEGSVLLGERDITHMAAAKRPVNTVFQSYALFPHLCVSDNVAFGLRSRGIATHEITARVRDALATVQMTELAARRPETLSGGQKQRVALARALVNEPAVLLLDEPMSALDARLRTHLQSELRALHRRLRTTFILVTHDQDEAMSVSDRVVVMHQGRIEQVGSPREVYDHPRTRFVADFVGNSNILEILGHSGRLVSTHAGSFELCGSFTIDSCVSIRPEDITIQGSASGGMGVVDDVIFKGDSAEVHIVPLGIRAKVAAANAPRVGEHVDLTVDASRVRVLHG
jgi:spermidine/putrescine transport system ATP-binding protein